jgi:hypothetical protein
MSKRTTFTSITPLPKTVTRSAAINWLHNHVQMIRLNPLVIRLQETTPPPNAGADEYNCVWYEITDEISYLPGGLYKGEVTYKACFNDLPNGTQTHTFAPAGLDLRGKWTVGGNEPGEPRETLELGMDVPREGLYVREDVDMRCNIFLTGFVKKNLTKSHKSVVDKLASLGDGHEQVEVVLASALRLSPGTTTIGLLHLSTATPCSVQTRTSEIRLTLSLSHLSTRIRRMPTQTLV